MKLPIQSPDEGWWSDEPQLTACCLMVAPRKARARQIVSLPGRWNFCDYLALVSSQPSQRFRRPMCHRLQALSPFNLQNLVTAESVIIATSDEMQLRVSS